MTNYKNFIINKKFISSLVFLRLLYLSSTAQAAGLPYFEPKSVVGENKVESLSVEDDNVALTISIGRGRGKSAVSEKKSNPIHKRGKSFSPSVKFNIEDTSTRNSNEIPSALGNIGHSSVLVIPAFDINAQTTIDDDSKINKTSRISLKDRHLAPQGDDKERLGNHSRNPSGEFNPGTRSRSSTAGSGRYSKGGGGTPRDIITKSEDNTGTVQERRRSNLQNDLNGYINDLRNMVQSVIQKIGGDSNVVRLANIRNFTPPTNTHDNIVACVDDILKASLAKNYYNNVTSFIEGISSENPPLITNEKKGIFFLKNTNKSGEEELNRILKTRQIIKDIIRTADELDKVGGRIHKRSSLNTDSGEPKIEFFQGYEENKSDVNASKEAAKNLTELRLSSNASVPSLLEFSPNSSIPQNADDDNKSSGGSSVSDNEDNTNKLDIPIDDPRRLSAIPIPSEIENTDENKNPFLDNNSDSDSTETLHAPEDNLEDDNKLKRKTINSGRNSPSESDSLRLAEPLNDSKRKSLGMVMDALNSIALTKPNDMVENKNPEDTSALQENKSDLLSQDEEIEFDELVFQPTPEQIEEMNDQDIATQIEDNPVVIMTAEQGNYMQESNSLDAQLQEAEVESKDLSEGIATAEDNPVVIMTAEQVNYMQESNSLDAHLQETEIESKDLSKDITIVNIGDNQVSQEFSSATQPNIQQQINSASFTNLEQNINFNDSNINLTPSINDVNFLASESSDFDLSRISAVVLGKDTVDNLDNVHSSVIDNLKNAADSLDNNFQQTISDFSMKCEELGIDCNSLTSLLKPAASGNGSGLPPEYQKLALAAMLANSDSQQVKKQLTARADIFHGRYATKLAQHNLGQRLDYRAAIAAGDEKMKLDNIWFSVGRTKVFQGQYRATDAYVGSNSSASIGVEFDSNDTNNILGFSYSNNHSEFRYKYDREGDQTKANSHVAAIYGQYELSKFLLHGMASYAYSKITNIDYKPVIDSHQPIGVGKPKGDSYSLVSNINYPWKLKDNTHLIPYIGMRYSYHKQSSYTEEGAGDLNRYYQSLNDKMLSGVLGIKIIIPGSDCNNWAITPTIWANAEKVLYEKTSKTKTKFAILSDYDFTSQEESSIKQPKITYSTGGNISVKKANFEIITAYNYTYRKKFHAHQGSIKLRISF